MERIGETNTRCIVKNSNEPGILNAIILCCDVTYSTGLRSEKITGGQTGGTDEGTVLI